MSKDVLALLIAVGSLVVAGLVHFASVQRDKDMEKRALAREDDLRAEDAREAAIADVVKTYEALRIQTGAGANLMTVRDAGIARLRSDTDMRVAIARMSAGGANPMGEFRQILGEIDLVELFDTSLEQNIPVDRAIEAVWRRKHS